MTAKPICKTVLDYYVGHWPGNPALYAPSNGDSGGVEKPVFKVDGQTDLLNLDDLKERAKEGLSDLFCPNPDVEGAENDPFTLLQIERRPRGLHAPGLLLNDGGVMHVLVPHRDRMGPTALRAFRDKLIGQLKKLCCQPVLVTRISTKAKVCNAEILEDHKIELWQAHDEFRVWADLEKLPVGNKDKNAVICPDTRFLCRGGSFLIVAPAGVGKSTLLMQMAISWSTNRDFFGLKPRKALRCFLIQGENDDGDVAEMAQGIVAGLGLKKAEINQLRVNFVTEPMTDVSKIGGFESHLERLIKFHRPDVFFIDPLFAFLTGDFNSQVYGSEIFRRRIGPVLKRTGCILVASHHTPKPSNNPSRGGIDFGYAGFGTSELTNWFRAVATLRPEKGMSQTYRFIVAKRGNRAGFPNGYNYCLMRHSQGKLFWEPVPANTPAKSPRSPGGQDYETERQARKLLALLKLTAPASRDHILARIMSAKGLKARQAAKYWQMIRPHFVKVGSDYTLIPPEDLPPAPVPDSPDDSDNFESATAKPPVRSEQQPGRTKPPTKPSHRPRPK